MISQLPGHEPDVPADSNPDDAPVSQGARADALSRRRTAVAAGLLSLIPLSALAVVVVLQLMASGAAAATGGCGGG
jgi:hypothetical protein